MHYGIVFNRCAIYTLAFMVISCGELAQMLIKSSACARICNARYHFLIAMNTGMGNADTTQYKTDAHHPG